MERVHTAHSAVAIEMAGAFVISGPQLASNVPDWVVQAMAADPTIEQIACNRQDSGTVYSRIPTPGGGAAEK